LANLDVSYLALFGDTQSIPCLIGAGAVRFLLTGVALEGLELGSFIKAAS